MLEEMVKAIIKKVVAVDYPHQKLPAVVYASVSAVRPLGTFDWSELVIYNDETGGHYRGHIEAQWYEYTLTVLDRFGSPDPAYPPLPQVKSRKQLEAGAIVAAALPFGELTPSIIGEVRL